MNFKRAWLNQFDSKEHILFDLISLEYWKSMEVVMKNLQAKDLNISNKSGDSLFYVLSEKTLLAPNFSSEFIVDLIFKTSSLKLSSKQYLEFYRGAIKADNHLLMNILLEKKYPQLDSFTQNLFRKEIFVKLDTSLNKNFFNKDIILTWAKYFLQETNTDGNNILQYILNKMTQSSWYYNTLYTSMIDEIIDYLKTKPSDELVSFFENKNVNQQNILDICNILKDKHDTFYSCYEKIFITFEHVLFDYKINNIVKIENKPIKKRKI